VPFGSIARQRAVRLVRRSIAKAVTMNVRYNADGDGPSGSIGSTSSGLLERARTCDPDAWQRLTHVYGNAIYDSARSAGLQEADAADVVQEVLVAVLKNLKDFRPARSKGSFRSWLWTIFRNNLRDRFRRDATHVRAVGGSNAQAKLESLEAPILGLPVEELMQTFDSALLRGMLESIRPEFEDRTWQAFWRYAMTPQDAEGVARDLGITAASVYAAKSRVLKRLRQESTKLRE
jgi:RNA polymerase sigma-70 factor (ECF subfamily)